MQRKENDMQREEWEVIESPAKRGMAIQAFSPDTGNDRIVADKLREEDAQLIVNAVMTVGGLLVDEGDTDDLDHDPPELVSP